MATPVQEKVISGSSTAAPAPTSPSIKVEIPVVPSDAPSLEGRVDVSEIGSRDLLCSDSDEENDSYSFNSDEIISDSSSDEETTRFREEREAWREQCINGTIKHYAHASKKELIELWDYWSRYNFSKESFMWTVNSARSRYSLGEISFPDDTVENTRNPSNLEAIKRAEGFSQQAEVKVQQIHEEDIKTNDEVEAGFEFIVSDSSSSKIAEVKKDDSPPSLMSRVSQGFWNTFSGFYSAKK